MVELLNTTQGEEFTDELTDDCLDRPPEKGACLSTPACSWQTRVD